MNPVWKSFAKWSIALLILSYLVFNLVDQWQVVSQYDWTISPFYVFVALVLAVITFIYVVWIWHKMLLHLDSVISYKATFRIWFVSALLRYLPGKVMGVLSMVYLCEKEGISKTTTLSSGAMNQGFSLLSGLSLGLAYFMIHPSDAITNEVILWAVIVMIAFFAFTPLLLKKVINPFFQKRNWTNIDWRLSWSKFGYFFVTYLFVWGLFGIGFYFVVKSVTTISYGLIFEMVAIFTISYLAGFLAIITPGGLGVREGLMTALLMSHMPMPVAIVVAGIARIWLTVAELLCITVAYKLR